MSLSVLMARSQEEKRTTYRMRFEVMCKELGWLSPQDFAEPEERDEYDDRQALSFLALDNDGQPAGTARLLLPGPIPLPIERHFELVGRASIEDAHGRLAYAAEVSRFIVPPHPRYRRHEITHALCMALLGTLLGMGASHAYISADHRFFRLLVMLGFPFAAIGASREYLGSPTVPGIVNLPDLAERLRREKPALYELLCASGPANIDKERAALDLAA